MFCFKLDATMVKSTDINKGNIIEESKVAGASKKKNKEAICVDKRALSTKQRKKHFFAQYKGENKKTTQVLNQGSKESPHHHGERANSHIGL
jgi:hypothetical protein